MKAGTLLQMTQDSYMLIESVGEDKRTTLLGVGRLSKGELVVYTGEYQKGTTSTDLYCYYKVTSGRLTGWISDGPFEVCR